ncbi:hypothetical protein LSH36_520g01046 [Paralvinella palmiformis]|uniref:Uncharacterized protein n=1 Tax=Paralvinella palmiformis TaxID=53620 RepID=A0AAD9J7E9_9ANNE|nr:hypothetical protein LSH36_520g01046 [Paralvinella palmiformis]
MACSSVITSTLLQLSALVIFICLNNARGASFQSKEEAELEESTNGSEIDSKTVIVLACAFGGGLLLGALWCYCMSAVCKTRQTDFKRLRLSAPTQRSHFIRDHYPPIQRPGYSLDSPTASDLSSRTPSPLP